MHKGNFETRRPVRKCPEARRKQLKKKTTQRKKKPKAAEALTDEEVNILCEKYLGFRRSDARSACTFRIKT